MPVSLTFFPRDTEIRSALFCMVLERLTGLFAGDLRGEDTDLLSGNLWPEAQGANKDKDPSHMGQDYTDWFLINSTSQALRWP
jgi:hypothetical protein